MENNKNLFRISFGNKTDIGKVRDRNEDYLESFPWQNGHVFVVCDGMGGHIGGEIASRLAASTIKNVFITNPKKLTSTYELIEESLNEANKAVLAKSKSDSSLRGMGTTCVILVLKNNMAYYGHIGDSRLYLIRAGNIYQLTRDHSIVQDLVDANYISDKEAEFHPRKNEITRALGVTSEISPDINRKGILVYKNDIFILCSDGLSNLVSEREMMEVALNNTPINASSLLVDMANTAGGTDNITVQVVKILEGNQLPKEFENVIPEGAVVKSDIQRIKEKSDEQKFGKSKTFKNKIFYIILPLLVLILVLLAVFIFMREESVDNPEKETTTKIKGGKEFDNKLKDDIRSILEYIYLSKEYPTNIKFDAKREIEIIDRNGSTSRISIDSLRLKYISKPFNKVRIQNERSEEKKCNFILENEIRYEYELEFKIDENKIVFERIRFLKDITPKPEPEKKDVNIPQKKKQTDTQRQPQPKKDNNEKKEKQNAKEREPLPKDK